MARYFNPILNAESAPEGAATTLMKSLLAIQERKDRKAALDRELAMREASQQSLEQERQQQALNFELERQQKLYDLAQQAEYAKHHAGVSADAAKSAIKVNEAKQLADTKTAAEQQSAAIQGAAAAHDADVQATMGTNDAQLQAATAAAAPPPANAEGAPAPAPKPMEVPTPTPAPHPAPYVFNIGGQKIERPLLTYEEKQAQDEQDFLTKLRRDTAIAKAQAEARGEAASVDIPNDPAKYGLFAGKSVPASIAAVLIKPHGVREDIAPVPGGYLDDKGKFHRTAPPTAAEMGHKAADEWSPEDLQYFPQSWMDVGEGTKTAESYTTRNGQRTAAQDAAVKAGLVLPDKNAKEEAQAGQRVLAQTQQLINMMNAPVDPKNPNGPKVKDFFGPGESPLASLRMRGWLGKGQRLKVPEAVVQARQRLGKFSAKERHELFGSALTKIESNYSADFVPDMNLPGDTIIEQLQGYGNQVKTGLDATWGAGRLSTPATTGSKADKIKSMLDKYGK